MPTLTITLDTKFLALAAAGVGAAAMLWRARKVRETTIWWIRQHKRYALASCKSSDLIVITDFDATLTSGDSEQCHDLMGSSSLLSAEFRAEFAPLLDWASNAAIDGVEWWDRAHSFMIKHAQPPRQLIPRLVREAKMTPRPGALELLKRLETLGVPVLIVSAGVSDVIEEFLRQHGALSENVTICSNRLNYAADSAPKSVSPDPPITSFTKQYAYQSASSFFNDHSTRRSIVQLGDSLTDVDPAKKVPCDRLISIGFLNDRRDESAHTATFDAVVRGNQGSLAPVTQLLDLVAPSIASPSALLRSLSSKSLSSLASIGSVLAVAS